MLERGASDIIQLLSGIVLVARQVIQLSANPREDVATLRWFTLVAGAVLTLGAVGASANFVRSSFAPA